MAHDYILTAGEGPPPDAGADGPALTAGFGATRYGPACALVVVGSE